MKVSRGAEAKTPPPPEALLWDLGARRQTIGILPGPCIMYVLPAQGKGHTPAPPGKARRDPETQETGQGHRPRRPWRKGPPLRPVLDGTDPRARTSHVVAHFPPAPGIKGGPLGSFPGPLGLPRRYSKN